MSRITKLIYVLNLFLLSFLIFLNIENNLININTPTYLISAINQKNKDAKDTEVWILNYKKPFLNNKNFKNWFEKDGAYYSDGKEENYINVKNQEKIIFIKHQWSGIVSIENTNTKEKKVIDLYSTTDNSYIYNLEILQTNLFSYYSVRVLVFSLLAISIHLLISLVLLIKFPKIKLKFNIDNRTVFFLLTLFSLISVIYLVAFYPGLLSPDSLDQWKQITTFQLKDNHPAFHTLIYWIITRIYYNPVSISIFQIICLSAMWIYGITSIIYTFKPNTIKKILILLISFIFFATPQNGLMAITLWKDVLFSYSIFFLTINLFNIISKKNWINKSLNKILLILSLILVCLLRHNGVISYIGTVIGLILIYKTKFLKIIIISVLIIICIKYPLYNLLKIKKLEGITSSGYALNYLNGYVYSDLSIKEKYKKFYDNLYPKIDSNIFYNSYCTNYNGVGLNFIFFEKEKNKILEYAKTEIVNNPIILINEIKKRSSLIWQIRQPAETYTYTTPIDDYDSRTILKEVYKIASFNPDSSLTFFIRKTIYHTESEKYKSLFWRPALNLIIILFISLYLFKKNKNILLLLPLIPILTLSAGLILTIPGQDYRYLFSNYHIMLYCLLLLINNKKL